jgi:CRP-like cAMP-binding protein
MPLFDASPFLAMVSEGKVTSDFRASETVFRQGARADMVHYLVSGSIKEVVASGGARREAIIGLLEAGDFFGTDGLYGGDVLSCSAIALRPSRVVSLTNHSMVVALRDPGFSRLFVGYLLERNSRIEAEKIDLLFNSTEKRLAQRLLSLAHFEAGTGASLVIGPEITQEVLANMVGTTRPRVNYFMTRFRDLGLIRYKPNDSIEITARLQRVVLREDKE